MKKLIILLLISSQVFAQDAKTIILHGTTLWLKNFTTGDSAQLNNRPFKTVGGIDLLGVGDVPIGSSDSATFQTKFRADSGRLNTYTAIAGKQATITTGTTAQYLKADLSLGTYSGYTLAVQALTSSPTDAQTIYFGMLPKAPVTAQGTSKIYIRQSGTIKRAEVYCYSGTAGTNEAWPIYIRLNNSGDTQIASVSLATSERVFSNTSLSISVSAGDYIEIKSINPTWATNPLTCIFGGYIYIE